MDKAIEKIFKGIPIIKKDQKYWFIRTEAGKYYNAYIEHNLVAIGHNKVRFESVTKILKSNKNINKELNDLAKIYYPEAKRPGLITSQILRFFQEVKKGDLVIIPSSSCSEISVGVIEDDDVFEKEIQNIEGEESCPFKKCRQVKWFKQVVKGDLNPNMIALFFSHQTITSANEYSRWIDNLLNNFYTKDNQTHLLIPIETQKNISAKELFGFCSQLLELTDEFLENENIAENTFDISLKTSLNSPGVLELAGTSMLLLTIVGLILVGLAGGGFEIKTQKTTIKIKTDGFIKKISDFLNSKSKRINADKVMVRALEDLQIKSPTDLVDILKNLK